MKRIALQSIVSAAVIVAATSSEALANSGISIEAVADYSAGGCGAHPWAITSADEFRKRMLSIPGFTTGIRYVDSSVFRTDFIDPQVAGGFGGGDQGNFDRPVDAISFVSAHGSCTDQSTIPCTSNSDCPDIGSEQHICTRFTESPLAGRCFYSDPKFIWVDDTSTPYCEGIDLTTGAVRLGESVNSGAFAGAGTNGGINAALLEISCGVTPEFWISQYADLFAGVSSVNTTMATRQGSDVISVAYRGKAWADRYVANQNSSVAGSWGDALNSVSGGGGCPFGGGGHGWVGCGAHVSMAVDTSQSLADWSLHTESWTQLRDESNDPNGTGWMSVIFTCNYDCIAHPWLL
jgi:hypothetical protein